MDKKHTPAPSQSNPPVPEGKVPSNKRSAVPPTGFKLSQSLSQDNQAIGDIQNKVGNVDEEDENKDGLKPRYPIPNQSVDVVLHNGNKRSKFQPKPSEARHIFKGHTDLYEFHELIASMAERWSYEDLWDIKLTFSQFQKKDREECLAEHINTSYRSWVQPWVAAEVTAILVVAQRYHIDLAQILADTPFRTVFTDVLRGELTTKQGSHHGYGRTKEDVIRDAIRLKRDWASFHRKCQQFSTDLRF
jgi:hypothetical protein